MPLLEVRNLRTHYRLGPSWLKVVDDVSFQVESSKTVGLVGESGCGKSSLAFSVLRLLPPNGRIVSGKILFGGQDLLSLSNEEMRAVRWKRISMIFQSAMSSLNPVMRVGDILTEALRTHEAVSKSEARYRILELFEKVELSPRCLDVYAHELSGGMKQRVVIAMSLLCKPALVLADEPTTALDVVVQDQILRELKAAARDLGVSLVVISHDLSVIAQVCDAVAVMYAGQIIENADVVRIFKEPHHPYTIGLMESFPSLVGPRIRLISMPGNPPNLLEEQTGCRFKSRCPLAAEICDIAPPLTQVSEGHLCRCHFALEQKVISLRSGSIAWTQRAAS